MAYIMAVANGNNTWETAASRMFAAVLQFGMREYEQAEAFGSADVRAPLFFALADAYLNSAPSSLGLADYGVIKVAVGDRVLAVDEMGRMTLHFRGPAGTLPRYSIADIINRRIPPHALAGKVIVVGVTAAALGDRFATPVGADFPGVEILATGVDNVLAGDFLYRSLKTKSEEEIASWILGLGITFGAAFMTALPSLGLTILLSVGYLCYAGLRLVSGGALVGFVLPWLTVWFTYLAVVSHRYITEGRRGEILARFLSPQLAPYPWGIPTPWSVMSRRSAAFAEDRHSRQSPIVMLM